MNDPQLEGHMASYIGRRKFLATLGGAAAAWPLTARAQQPERMRRIGVLMSQAADDPVGQPRLLALAQGLQEAGWTVGRNLQIDTRWAASDAERFRKYAAELVALAPDVILVNGPAALAQLQQATRSVPIVFTAVTDPVGAGHVDSLARPGGNVTGFMNSEYSTSGKWLELLKEIAPRVTRAAVIRDPTSTSSVGQFAAIQSAAGSFGVELSAIDMRNAGEIERAVTAFARASNGGLIVTTGGSSTRRSVIIAAAAWPLAAYAQQPERVRRIGSLTGIADDSMTQARLATFLETLQQLGWTEGQNVQVDRRWGGGDADRIRKYAAELATLNPDVILATGAPATQQLLLATRTVPIVFVLVPDPVGSGFVESLSRPGGNATGFMQFEYGLSGKWLELLKEIAPGVTRAAVLRDPALPAGVGQFAVIQSVASSIGLDVRPVNLRDAGEIERAVTAFARSANGGLVVTASALSLVHSELILALAARHKLPAIYSRRSFVAAGGLISYGFNALDQVQRAAGYVDRILKGEKPSDLPVQAPIKYELVINLKTAKALGIDLPATVLARADEVIE